MKHVWMAALAALLAVTAGADASLAQQKARPRAAPAAAAKPAPAQTDWLKVIAATPEGGVRQGNPNAPFKLVEYGSRSCPTCGYFAHVGVDPLRAKYVATGKVSYEYRDFWVHAQDPGLSVLGHCVPTAQFFAVLDDMYAQQKSFNDRMTEALAGEVGKLPQIRQPGEYARRLGYLPLMAAHGVPAAKANQCLGDAAMLNLRVKRVREAIALGVQSTPTFFINGSRLDDVVVWEQLEPVLQTLGA